MNYHLFEIIILIIVCLYPNVSPVQSNKSSFYFLVKIDRWRWNWSAATCKLISHLFNQYKIKREKRNKLNGNHSIFIDVCSVVKQLPRARSTQSATQSGMGIIIDGSLNKVKIVGQNAYPFQLVFFVMQFTIQESIETSMNVAIVQLELHLCCSNRTRHDTNTKTIRAKRNRSKMWKTRKREREREREKTRLWRYMQRAP